MIYFGASYYPVQLDPNEVGPDARLMQAAGLNLVRMGEFAWSRMESDDGQFDFSWLENAVETLARHGIKSLLGTPTAAPPKWLTDKHPDICQVNADVIHPVEKLTDYKLVLAPSLLLMDQKRAAHLRNYVEQGGTLVLTVQSGLRNFEHVFYRQTLPAFLTDLCGIEIEEQNGLKLQDTVGIAAMNEGYAKSRYECSLLFEIRHRQF